MRTNKKFQIFSNLFLKGYESIDIFPIPCSQSTVKGVEVSEGISLVAILKILITKCFETKL